MHLALVKGGEIWLYTWMHFGQPCYADCIVWQYSFQMTLQCMKSNVDVVTYHLHSVVYKTVIIIAT